MCDTNEVKWVDSGGLPFDTPSKAGYASAEPEEAPEILITDLGDLKKLHRIFQSDSSNSAGAKQE